ncbi:MAG TPA: hypothetical protein PKO44_07195 [Candidatus Omnitrophota bacterium]|nr:hypothetical protein [Candidatus Omnitrophota bacterium]
MKTIFIVVACLLFASSAFSQEKKSPQWVQALIQRYENMPVANPALSISRCEYRGETVYYVPPQCCDIPSILFNEEGKEVCSPDGGEGGDGDGTCTDFFVERKNCEVLWKDPR